MYLESREHISGVPQLLVEVMIGVVHRAWLETLIGSLTENAAHGSVEQRLNLCADIELLAIDIAKSPYKQFLVKLQTDDRRIVRIEVNMIDYQSKGAPSCGAFTKKERRRSFNFEL